MNTGRARVVREWAYKLARVDGVPSPTVLAVKSFMLKNFNLPILDDYRWRRWLSTLINGQTFGVGGRQVAN